MSYFANIQECRSVNRFDKIELRGEGTYGQVLRVAAARASALLTSTLVCVCGRQSTARRRRHTLIIGGLVQVFMARDRETQQVMALKRMKMEKEQVKHTRTYTLAGALRAKPPPTHTQKHTNAQEGFPVTALRELTILKRMKHPNIVNMVEVVVGVKQESVFLVFEYCEHDLATLLGSEHPPTTREHT